MKITHSRPIQIGLGTLPLLFLSLAASAQDAPKIESKIVIDSHTLRIQTPIGPINVGKVVLNGKTYFNIGPLFGARSATQPGRPILPNLRVPPYQPFVAPQATVNAAPLVGERDPKTGILRFGVGPTF